MRKLLVVMGLVAGFGCSNEQSQTAPLDQHESSSDAPSAKTANDLDGMSIETEQPTAEGGSERCGELQQEVQAAVGDEDERYRNHGAYVSAVANLVDAESESGEISEECAGCIVSQFARRIPVADQESCGDVPDLIICTEENTTPEGIRAAVYSALDVAPNAWGDSDDWKIFLSAVEAEIGCTLPKEDDETEQAMRQQQTHFEGRPHTDSMDRERSFACFGGGDTPGVGETPRYCGPGFGSGVGGINLRVPSCLNQACCAHDLCYEDCEVGGNLCFWSDQTENCDASSILPEICSGDDPRETGGCSSLELLRPSARVICDLVDCLYSPSIFDPVCLAAREARKLFCPGPPDGFCGECSDWVDDCWDLIGDPGAGGCLFCQDWVCHVLVGCV